jgi:RimJ/RimL family protein N-acetyltransferase
MIAIEYDLSRLPIKEDSSPIAVDRMEFIPKRLREITPEYEAKIKGVLYRMDFKPPFDIQEAKRRLKKGYYFIILENDIEIIGWSWAAINRVFFDEFNCHINIKGKHAFFFNTYVYKGFRGKGLNHIVFHEKLHQLKKDGYDKIWGLIYKSNKPSRRSFQKIGFEEIGSYRFAKLLFMNFRFPPKGI